MQKVCVSWKSHVSDIRTLWYQIIRALEYAPYRLKRHKQQQHIDNLAIV